MSARTWTEVKFIFLEFLMPTFISFSLTPGIKAGEHGIDLAEKGFGYLQASGVIKIFK